MNIKHVMKLLTDAGLRPYIYYKATTGSCYIKFEQFGMNSLRIADHAGRSKYRYKWNLRSDITEIKTEQEGKVKRFYYPYKDLDKMITHMSNYRDTILRNHCRKVSRSN